MFSLCLQPKTRQGGGGGASLRNFVRGPTASSLALPQTCLAPLSQSLPLSEPQSKPSRGRTSLGLPPLSLCLLWVFDASHFRLGFSEGMTCMCPSPRCPWSVRGVDRWMNRQTERQARVAAETASLASSLYMPWACAARQVARQMAGPQGPMDARCCGHLVGSSSLRAAGHHQGRAPDVQNPGGG